MTSTLYPAGTRINDRYQLLEHIGGGSNGDVYRAYDDVFENEVALKLLKPKGGAPATWDEARILEQLRSDFLLPVINADVVGSSDLRYITTQLMTGGDLEQAGAPFGVPVADGVRWGQQLAHALDRVHAGGMLHRDVKPANGFLRDGDAMLGDLGLAVLIPADGRAPRDGTWVTLAPEAAPNAGYCGLASDVYSLAATVFYLLTGEYPVDHRLSAREQQARIAAGRRRRLRDLAPHVSRSLGSVVEKGLSTDPLDRHPSALAFGNALAGATLHHRPWTRVVHPGHVLCLRGDAAGPAKPVNVCCTTAGGAGITVVARLDSGRRAAGVADAVVSRANLAKHLRALTERL